MVSKKMKQGKIIQEPEYFRNRCPFCYEKLGMKATWKRKIKKVCYCPNCRCFGQKNRCKIIFRNKLNGFLCEKI